MSRAFLLLLLLAAAAVVFVACRGSELGVAGPQPTAAASTAVATQPPAPIVETPELTTPTAVVPIAPEVTATPFFTGEPSQPCGVHLSPLPPQTAANAMTSLAISDATRAALRAQAPAAAWPALQRLLDAPGTVGLVAFHAGQQAQGARLNADIPMPLASVAKLVTLAAYAEALAAGELNALEPVRLEELDRFYLPNFDLGAHRRAVEELRQNGELLPPEDDPSVLLEDVAWMMIRHSSNAATDYLHDRLGQARIEETAVALGLNDAPAGHSAPCSFLGQFLMMANHARGVANDTAALAAYAGGGAAEAQDFGREMALLAEAYANDEAFRAAEREWRTLNRRPSGDTQRYFAANLAPQGTAGAYAALMLRLAQNGLSNADSSYQARRILEWPNQFQDNLDVFSNVGYKNGSLPGVLNTTYYAYRWDTGALTVVVLFFRDLPQQTYREWRNELPHDELARWLLADPAAIPALAAVLREAAP